jgi:hypothetical protein
MSELIKYQETRALEDVAFRLGGTPMRLWRMLLPVHEVEVRATVYESEPYDLIDRYVDAAVGRCGLGTVGELAGLLGLDEELTDRAVRFLTAIGHLGRDPATGRLVLSDLGQLSVREGRRYRRELEDRRKLYFDGFTCGPLTRRYYDTTFLDQAAMAAELADRGPSFRPLISFSGPQLDPVALTALAEMKDRDEYNLPAAVVSPTLLKSTTVYLPAYVVRAAIGGRLGHRAYTQVANAGDDNWSAVCSGAPEITALTENEDSEDRQDHEDAARRWVSTRFAGRFELGQQDMLLQATLPADAFTRPDADSGAGPGIPLSRLGSFVMMNTWFFRLWCDDSTLRHQALLARADAYLGSRTLTSAADATERLTQFGRQLGLAAMPVGELRALAENAGLGTLAAQLNRLAELGG